MTVSILTGFPPSPAVSPPLPVPKTRSTRESLCQTTRSRNLTYSMRCSGGGHACQGHRTAEHSFSHCKKMYAAHHLANCKQEVGAAGREGRAWRDGRALTWERFNQHPLLAFDVFVGCRDCSLAHAVEAVLEPKRKVVCVEGGVPQNTLNHVAARPKIRVRGRS